jgi:hypothetical protein
MLHAASRFRFSSSLVWAARHAQTIRPKKKFLPRSVERARMPLSHCRTHRRPMKRRTSSTFRLSIIETFFCRNVLFHCSFSGAVEVCVRAPIFPARNYAVVSRYSATLLVLMFIVSNVRAVNGFSESLFVQCFTAYSFSSQTACEYDQRKQYHGHRPIET